MTSIEFECVNECEYDECPICYQTKPKVRLVACGHTCCNECLEQWMSRGRDTCALCRHKIIGLKYYKLIEKNKVKYNNFNLTFMSNTVIST